MRGDTIRRVGITKLVRKGCIVVRRATIEDSDDILRILSDFHRKTEFRNFTFSEDKVRRKISTVLKRWNTDCLLVAVVNENIRGFTLASVGDYILSDDSTITTINVVSVDGFIEGLPTSARVLVRLMGAVKVWSKKNGSSFTLLHVTSGKNICQFAYNERTGSKVPRWILRNMKKYFIKRKYIISFFTSLLVLVLFGTLRSNDGKCNGFDEIYFSVSEFRSRFIEYNMKDEILSKDRTVCVNSLVDVDYRVCEEVFRYRGDDYKVTAAYNIKSCSYAESAFMIENLDMNGEKND